MFESAITPPTFRALSLVLRPARTATAIWPKEWQITATRMMECYSRMWGGVGNILVASTEDSLIDDRFWPLLSAFDPDSYATYLPTRRGQHLANPEGFEEWLDKEAAKFASTGGMSFDEARATLLEDRFYRSPLSSWSPDESVANHIRHWMAPFAISDLVFVDSFSADTKAHSMSGFTDLMDLALTPGEMVVIRVEDLPPEVQLLVDTRIGAVAPAFRTELEADGWTITEIPAGPDVLDALLDLAWRGQIDTSMWEIRAALGEAEGQAPHRSQIMEADVLSRTPFAVGLVGCDSFVPFNSRWDERPIYVVVGDTAEDYSLALGLDRGWSRGLWLPWSLASVDAGAETKLAEAVVRALGSILHKLTRSGGHERDTVFTSMSLDANSLGAVAEAIQQSIWGDDLALRIEDPRDIEYPQPQRVLDRAHLSETRHVPFTREDMVSQLSPPLVPSEARAKDRPQDCQWYIDIKVNDLSVPSRWDLAERIRQGNEMSGGKLRPGRDGISAYSHRQGLIPGGATLDQMLERAHIRIPDGPEIFHALLARRNLRAELSDKGRFAAATIERWGGMQSMLASLRDEAAYAILHSYATPSEKPRPGVSLIDPAEPGRRHFLAMDDITELTGRLASECIPILDDLVRRRVLRRGFVLKCRRCSFAGWYDLTQIDQGFECSRCAETQLMSVDHWREPVEQPKIYYDLDEVIYQTLLNDGAVTLLALGTIADRNRDFMYSTEMHVFEEGVPQPFCEIDLWAVSRGEIIIGEAKRGNSLGNNRSAKKSAASLGRVAEAASADVLILATASDSWKASATDLVEQEISELPTRLETLTNVAPPRPWE